MGLLTGCVMVTWRSCVSRLYDTVRLDGELAQAIDDIARQTTDVTRIVVLRVIYNAFFGFFSFFRLFIVYPFCSIQLLLPSLSGLILGAEIYLFIYTKICPI